MSPHKTRLLGLVEGENLSCLAGKVKFLACARSRRIGECTREREEARGRRHASPALLKLARPVCYSEYGISFNKLKIKIDAPPENVTFKKMYGISQASISSIFVFNY